MLEESTLTNTELAKQLLTTQGQLDVSQESSLLYGQTEEQDRVSVLCEELTEANEDIEELEQQKREQANLNLQLGSALATSRRRVVALEAELRQCCELTEIDGGNSR